MNVDNIIEKLLSVGGNKPGKQVDLKDEEINFLIDKSLPIIKEEKMLVELEAPFMYVGIYMGNIMIYYIYNIVDILEIINIYS